VIELQEQSRSETDYTASIRAAFRAMWLSLIGIDQFADVMVGLLRRGLENAWKDGVKECNYTLDELDIGQRIQLELDVTEQFQYIRRVGEFIEQGSKENGGDWATVNKRVDLWANKYREAKAKAASFACGDKKKRFVLGPTEEHCRSCLGLNGRIYRYSVWQANNAIPPSSAFECGGFR
jgi:hypothetical protein